MTAALRFRPGIFLLAILSGSFTARADHSDRIAIGSGPSRIVEYDAEFRPVRTYVGLQRPTDITPLPDGSILVADAGTHEVLSFDPSDGRVISRRRFSSGVSRVRPRERGGFVVTSADRVLLTNAALEVEREIPMKGVRGAVELSNGHVLTVSNDEQGWLTEWRPDGSIRWRSKPRAHLDPAGKWEFERAGQSFVSTSSLDLRPNGTILLSDYDGHTLRLLSKDYEVLRNWAVPGLGHFLDTRFGPAGELVAVCPEKQAVWVERSGGDTRVWTAPGPSIPLTANLSTKGTLLVGFEWRPERERLNATSRRATLDERLPFFKSLFGWVFFGVSGALLLVLALRLRTQEPAAAPHDSSRPADAGVSKGPGIAPGSEDAGRRPAGRLRGLLEPELP